MTFFFSAMRANVARDKHDPRRWWLVFRFKTPRGEIKLMQSFRVSREIRKIRLTYDRAGSGQ